MRIILSCRTHGCEVTPAGDQPHFTTATDGLTPWEWTLDYADLHCPGSDESPTNEHEFVVGVFSTDDDWLAFAS